jgi:SpoVK/Ycf46/Vps4 family AAA+-type ATPase
MVLAAMSGLGHVAQLRKSVLALSKLKIRNTNVVRISPLKGSRSISKRPFMPYASSTYYCSSAHSSRYPVGGLSTDPKEAETQLSRIFRQAEKWKAVLLLDEADVFMRRRSLDHARDTHIVMFLRMLEYYRGIMFLTTNRVNDFDEAMQSRIHLAIRYPLLSKETRRTLWEHFLERGVDSKVDEKELDKVAERRLNSRQVREWNFRSRSLMLMHYRRSKMRFN